METLKRILELIKNNFPSSAEFEKTTNLTPKTVSDWKRGKSKSYYGMIPQLSELFNVSTESIKACIRYNVI